MTFDEAADELSMRLLFEYIFDIITESYLQGTKWLDDTLRDSGHHRRISLLYKKAQQSKKYKYFNF